MRVYLDCEWNSTDASGYGPLISIALVAEDGREFYEAMGCSFPSPWVAANVMPHLGERRLRRGLLQALLVDWLHHYTEVEIVADWPQDLQQFCDLLITGPGHRVPIPERLTLSLEEYDNTKSERPHHALYDARALAKAATEARGCA